MTESARVLADDRTLGPSRPPDRRRAASRRPRVLTADTVTGYYRTIHEWQPGLLSPSETAAISSLPQPTPQPRQPDGVAFSGDERAIVRALREDGRRTHEELARAAGISESTV